MKKLFLTSIFFASLLADPSIVELSGELDQSSSQENTEEKIETAQVDQEKNSRFDALKNQCIENKKALIGICVTAVSLIIGAIAYFNNQPSKKAPEPTCEPKKKFDPNELKDAVLNLLGKITKTKPLEEKNTLTPGGEDFDPKEIETAIKASLKFMEENIIHDTGDIERWSNPQEACQCSIFALANAMTHANLGNNCEDNAFLTAADLKKQDLQNKFESFLGHIKNLKNDEVRILENEHYYNIDYLISRPTWKECFSSNIPLDSLTYFFFVCIQGEMKNYSHMTPPLDEEMLTFLLEEFNKIKENEPAIDEEWLSTLKSNDFEATQYFLFAGLNKTLQNQIIETLKNLKKDGRICIPLLLKNRAHFVSLCIDANDTTNPLIVRDSINTTNYNINHCGLSESCLTKINETVESLPQSKYRAALDAPFGNLSPKAESF